MSGTRQDAGGVLAAKLDSAIEARERRVAVLMDELARAQHEVGKYRELRVLLDQVLDEPGMVSGADGPVGETSEARDAVKDRGARTNGADVDRPRVPAAATLEATMDSVPNEAPIDDVFEAFTARPGQVMSPAEILGLFPGASRVQISERLGRLVRQGKIIRVVKGRFRFDLPADEAAGHEAPPTPQQQREAENVTLREQITVIMRQAPGRGWRPRELAAVLTHTNPDDLWSLLRDMAHSSEIVQDDAGRYWPSRPSGVVAAQAADGRQVSMA
ncbi:hypothetical protein LWC34_19785 [Kibdelosporangium philippinense]|uniref:Uncharacterized protein n=1 Tax=Kibdelosporangium philippinense TaxID=211113 RepID=A0ABS8ZEC7_9PSEU|nr:hypothetical protein [Kibdelosporangium philippinense]MCE7005051.1 hypothetical protein [Kibdelosporangium philippinense]